MIQPNLPIPPGLLLSLSFSHAAPPPPPAPVFPRGDHHLLHLLSVPPTALLSPHPAPPAQISAPRPRLPVVISLKLCILPFLFFPSYQSDMLQERRDAGGRGKRRAGVAARHILIASDTAGENLALVLFPRNMKV